MSEEPGPDSLQALAARWHAPITQAEIDAFAAHAEAWRAERAERAALAGQLAVVQEKLAVLERERQWWKDNTIKRRKRAEARRSGH